jgi:hypothetical protein
MVPFLSPEEQRAAQQRVFQDAYDRLVIGPGQAFLAAGCAVFGIACLEGSHYVKPSLPFSQRAHFLARYGLAQVVPSVIWGQQPAATVARAAGISESTLRTCDELSPRRAMAVNRWIAVRGAIAGTILISQVISFASVASEAKEVYSKRIEKGRERPLHTRKHHNKGVVIRLAGKTSDVTSLTMRREGRQHIFPVFEEPSLVHPLLRCYSVQQGNYFMVPLFWHVQDKRYGYPESWSDLSIPRSWLFDVYENEKDTKRKQLLVLEADANRDDAGAMSLETSNMAANLDLDLYEVAQGFYQLQKLVKRGKNDSLKEEEEHETLCVLLADANSIVQRGGGERMTVRDYVFKLGLADVVIDTQSPIVLALRQWLESKDHHKASKKWNRRKHVIVETPEEQWFQSIKKALKQMGGFEVIDATEAVRLYGSAQGLPFIVCESNTINTTHTIRSIVEQKLTLPENICGLCASHQGLEETAVKHSSADGSAEVAVICSSDIQDRLFRKVREAAMRGESKEEIQRHLDENLATFLENSSGEKDWKLRLYL